MSNESGKPDLAYPRSDANYKKDLVSIITIFRDGARFFSEAADSIFSQTYDQWEWLLVDDGSIDESTAMAQVAARLHPGRVKYLCHPGLQNRGMSASRNLGLHHAAGEYIALLDVDDIWLPDKLTAQTAVLRQYQNVALVYGPLEFWYDWPGNETYRPHKGFVCRLGDRHDLVIEPPDAVLRQIRIADGLPGTCSITMRTEAALAIGGFEDSFTGMYEDEVFFSKLFMRYPTYLMSRHFDRYRQHQDSHSAMAIRNGEYIMGSGVPSRARYRFLVWLRDYAERSNQLEITRLIQQEIDTKYAQLKTS